LFDDKDLTEEDVVELWNKETLEKFATARLTSVVEKKLSELNDSDMEGHNPYATEAEMFNELQKYYQDKIGPDTRVKVIRFDLLH
jgi:hypothetical protein